MIKKEKNNLSFSKKLDIYYKHIITMKPKTQKQMLINQLAQLFPKNMEATLSDEQETMIKIVAQIENLKDTQNKIKQILTNANNGTNN